MSDIPADWRGQLDLRKELARIDRDRAETQKLLAEAMKFKRERWVVPLRAAGRATMGVKPWLCAGQSTSYPWPAGLWSSAM